MTITGQITERRQRTREKLVRAAITVFARSGNIIWPLAVSMAAANLSGGFLGAFMAVRHGNGFVRRVFLVVVSALALKLAWDTVQMFR